MNIFELLGLIQQNIFIYGGAFLFVLSLLVFIHEWGHYIVARWCGVKVEVFSIGFGKELFGWDDKKGTRWKLSLIPLGGYVKLFGDVDPASAGHSEEVKDDNTEEARPLTPAERNVAFFAKPVWQRALVVFAGPAINYLFAVLVMAILFAWNGQPSTPPKVGAVIGGSAAQEAGFKPHDVIVSINGKAIDSFDLIRREVTIALDEELHYVVERDGQTLDIHARAKKMTQKDRFGFNQSRGLLGLTSPRQMIDLSAVKKINGQPVADDTPLDDVVARTQALLGQEMTIALEKKSDSAEPAFETYVIQPIESYNEHLTDPDHEDYGLLYLSDGEVKIFIKYNPLEAVVAAVKETRDVTMGTLSALGQIVSGTRSAKELGGIVRIGALAGDMAKQGVVALVLFSALLSINLGLINLFPIPLLDGGHLVFYAFEAILRRPVPERVQEYAFRFGLVFLVGVMAFTNINDIMQLILPG